MDRSESKRRGIALRDYLQARLPMAGVPTIAALATSAGLRHSTLTAWWGKGTVPDGESLRRLADALGADPANLTAAYHGTAPAGGRVIVLTEQELDALMERAAEAAVRRVLAERDGN